MPTKTEMLQPSKELLSDFKVEQIHLEYRDLLAKVDDLSPQFMTQQTLLEERGELHFRPEVSKFFDANISKFTEQVIHSEGESRRRDNMEGVIMYGAYLFHRHARVQTIANILSAVPIPEDGVRDRELYLKLKLFNEAGPLTIKFDGLSILDFISKERDLTPADEYRFMAEITDVFFNDTKLQKIIDENNDYPKSEYPNITEALIDNAKYIFIGALSGVISEKEIKKLYDGKPKSIRRAIKPFTAFVRRVEESREKIFNLLMRPEESKEYAQLIEEVQRHIATTGDSAFETFFSVGIRLFNMGIYRGFKRLSQEGQIAPEFYALAADKLKELIENLADERYVRDGQVNEFFDLAGIGDLGGDFSASWDKFAALTKRIFSKTSKKEYVFGCEEIPEIASYFKLPPTQVHIKFDPAKPVWEFGVLLTWKNHETENLMSFSYNGKKKSFDWSLLEDPGSPLPEDLARTKMVVGLVSNKLLEKIDGQAGTKRDIVIDLTRSSVPKDSEKKPKRERVEDPIYIIRKDAKRRPPKPQGLRAVMRQLRGL